MVWIARTGSRGSRQLAFGLSTAAVALLTGMAGVAVAAQPAEPGSQRSATGQANSRAVAGTPARGNSAAPRKQTSTAAPQRRSSSSGKSSGSGANVSGPYDPNGVGLPSGNGRSESNNGNRPCAGCVGKADAKNPPGQLPGGNDSNRGYECDENQGIGKTNPAHSRCSPTTASGSPAPAAQPGGRVVGLGSITPAVLAKAPALAAVLPAVPAKAPALKPTGDVLGAVESRKKANGPAVNARVASPVPTARELAFTGLGLAWMALLGAAFMVGGRVLRRRTAPVQAEGRD